MVVKTEIEDVLSSIRRLVSEDMTARPFRAIPRDPRDLDDRIGDKLMLTSAHRVPAAHAAAAPWPADGAREGDALDESDDPAAEWDADAAADLGGEDLWDEDSAEGDTEGRSERDTADGTGPDVAADAEWSQEQEVTPDPPAGDPAAVWPEPRTTSSRLEETIAELEAAVSGVTDDFEADEGDAVPPQAGDDATLTAAFAASGAEAHGNAAEDGPDDVGDGEGAPPATTARAPGGADGSDAAAVAPAYSFASGRRAIDLPGAETPARTPRILRERRLHLDHEEADGATTATVAPVEEGEGAGRSDSTQPAPSPPRGAEEDDKLFDGDEAVVDLATLRQIVAEVLRQELQGALGERISRNVRKLVRREINRALDSREVE